MTTSHPAAESGTQRVHEMLQIIEGEYREMPCLSLTKPQMQRLWGLESFVCEALVDALVAASILRRTPSGAYVAATRNAEGRVNWRGSLIVTEADHDGSTRAERPSRDEAAA